MTNSLCVNIAPLRRRSIEGITRVVGLAFRRNRPFSIEKMFTRYHKRKKMKESDCFVADTIPWML